jgi:hypothetical protein
MSDNAAITSARQAGPRHHALPARSGVERCSTSMTFNREVAERARRREHRVPDRSARMKIPSERIRVSSIFGEAEAAELLLIAEARRHVRHHPRAVQVLGRQRTEVAGILATIRTPRTEQEQGPRRLRPAARRPLSSASVIDSWIAINRIGNIGTNASKNGASRLAERHHRRPRQRERSARRAGAPASFRATRTTQEHEQERPPRAEREVGEIDAPRRHRSTSTVSSAAVHGDGESPSVASHPRRS